MPELTFGGLSTGLPTDDIITSLMKVERLPLDNLEKSKTESSNKLKAYKEFDDLLEELRKTVSSMNDTSEARSTTATVGDDTLIGVTSTGASTGSYEIAVEQLAQVQKTVTNGVTSKTDQIFGSGSLTVGETSITIDETNNSLQGMMDAINAESETTGVTAAIIDDGSDSDNFHLVLTGKDASTTFDFKTSGLDINFDNTEGGTGASNTVEAQQAIAHVDGVKIVSNNNTLKDTISGLSIDLKSVSETKDDKLVTTTLNVEADTDTLKENITDFVAAYNGLMEWVVSSYEKQESTSSTTSTNSTDKDKEDEKSLSYLLRGDSTINSVKRNLQGVLGNAVGSSSRYNILSEIGIKTQQDGTLLINNTTLDKAIDENFDEVVNLMSGNEEEGGVMDKFNTYLVNETSSTQGMYALKKDSHDDNLASLNKQIEGKENILKSVEARYRSQFVALETLVSSMNSQSSFLTSFFSSNSTQSR